MAEDEGVEGSNINSATTALHEDIKLLLHLSSNGEVWAGRHDYIFTSQTIQCSVLCEFIEPHTVL